MELQQALRTAAEMGAVQALETLGLSSGEISYPKARKVYGKWFIDAVERGEIVPSRYGEGKQQCKRFFSVQDILARKCEREIKASLI